MIFENFDANNPSEMERLFEYIKKDKFESLSFDDQDRILDLLIDLATGDKQSNMTTIGIINGSDSSMDAKSIVDNIGRDAFKEALRESIMDDNMYASRVSMDDMKEILGKMKEGTATQEEMNILEGYIKKRFGKGIYHYNDSDDLSFSTFAILKAYSLYFSEQIKEDKEMFLKDIEPLITAADCVAMACVISNDKTPIGKMFKKHGYFKVQQDLIDLAGKITDMIVKFGQENNILPEKMFVALLHVLRILSGPLDISLDNYEDGRIEEALFQVLYAETHSSYDSIDKDIQRCFKSNDEDDDDTNVSTTHLANANNKESKNNVDIRKLLLDD